ncbi:MAG TPA: hypothetical protein VMJ10_08050 [Kofleriaceae bacterium]|nr:hypothetical protein [Kofleriaceae bacterium]
MKLIFPIATAIAAGCATTPVPEPTGGPRGLRASDHLEAAQVHEAQATPPLWPDMRPDATGHVPDTWQLPWYRSWDASAEHERIAELHRGAAAELQAEFEAACGSRSADQISISPLARFAIGGWPTATGAIMYLSPDAGDPDQLLADIKCHRAWMMLAPTGMDDCPLDLPGIVLDARGDKGGITVSIVVRDPKLVEELHRRVALELEASAHHHAPH